MPKIEPRKPKVVVDFDGVRTDMTGQAGAVNERREPMITEYSGSAPGRVKEALDAVKGQGFPFPWLQPTTGRERGRVPTGRT